MIIGLIRRPDDHVRTADAKPARRVSEAHIRHPEGIKRMGDDEPARRLSDADIRMAERGDGEAIRRMSSDSISATVTRSYG
ncbi:hypothetical protein [Methylobacterium sp. WSM2598]|uniref:hypothetical protein n=1 Tax=Methylobacterium sp. WSM2598 TaxID=398261 RepID=UPI00036170D5|nr:hypothetical protein [Methylobacterium sp. WSM2598]